MLSKPSQFKRIVEKHSKVIAAAVRRVCMQTYESLAPDVTQEIHLAVWKALKDEREIRNPSAYIYRVALTTGLRLVEREEKQANVVSLARTEAPSAAIDAQQRQSQANLLEDLLEELRPNESKALRAYLAGYNHEEIAELFEWTPSVARHNVYRSINKLRQRAGKPSSSDRKATHG